MLMADVVVKNTDTNNSVPNKKSKKWLFILPFILVIVIAAAIGGWIYNVNSNQIKLGGEIINKKIVDSYSKQIAISNKNNSINTNENLKENAKDILLMHAALKEKAKKYKVSISQKELDQEMNSIYESYGGKSQFEKFTKLQGIYEYNATFFENRVYMSKLENNVLQSKQLFIVGINIDTPYFNKNNSEQRLKLINDAKVKIQEKYYPYFKKNMDSKTIAKKVLAENEPYYLDYEHYRTRNKAYINDCKGKIENCFNDLPDYNVANAVYSSDRLKNLIKKGQYTDVFVSKAGFVGVVRLEDQRGENYMSWDDFLGQYRQHYKSKLEKIN
jgi:hypothetical protein